MPAFDQVTLRTARLLLRPLRDSDAEDIYAIFSDARVTRFLSRPPWTETEKAQELIAQDKDAMAAGRYLRLGIQPEGGERLVGECSLFNLVERARRAEIGYAMAHDAWGHGYMNEALRALLEFGFTQLDLNRVEADIDPRNEASARSLERLGFVSEGYLRQRWIVSGEVSDSRLYGLLRSEWRPTTP